MNEKEKNRDTISFGIIANAGDARSIAFMALQSAEKGEFAEAEKRIAAAKESVAKAHQQQTMLLFDEVNGKPSAINLLMVHAQDHLMTSMLAIELIESMIRTMKKQTEENESLRQQIDDLKAKLESIK